MNRRRQETAGVRISDEEYSRLENKFEALKNEFIACKRKLDSKCEALLILSRELDQCRSERDQFKLMAEQLRERHQSMKKQLSGQLSEPTSYLGSKQCTEKQSQNLMKILVEVKDQNKSLHFELEDTKQKLHDAQGDIKKILVEVKDQHKSLHFELEDTKQKLHDAQGDIKLLREQIARQRVGTTDEGMNTRHFPAHEREELVQKLESSRDQYLQLERDLQTVLDEKEELVTERDVYKTKYERLNQELNYILKGDENRVVDIDALVMENKEGLVTERDVYKTKYERLNQELNYILKGDENRVVDIDALVIENKYLQDRLKQMEAEKSMAMAAVSKYKSILEKKKNKSCMKLGQTRGGGMVISQKQVHEVLTSQAAVVPTPQAMSDLQALAGALLDTVNDKNLALSHQRKTNKILGNRVSELEKKIKTLEVAGLWNVSGHGPVQLEKLLQECNDMKTLIPQKVSHPDECDQLSVSDGDKDSELESVTPLDSLATTPDQSPTHTANVPDHLELGDLDLLPTKEVTCKPAVTDNSTDSNLPGQKLHSMSSNADVESFSLELSTHENGLPEQDLSHDFNKKSENAKDSFVMADSHEMIQTMNEGIESENPINNCNSIPNINPKSDELQNSQNNAKVNECTDSTSNKDSSENIGSQFDRLEVDNKSENPLSDSEEGSVKDFDKVHVYNEDKLEEQEDNKDTRADSGDIDRELDLNLDERGNQIDSDLGEIRELSELIEMPVDLKAGGDANSMFITTNAKNADKSVHNVGEEPGHIGENGDSENDDIETSERMGLLVESMAQKMCNISHKEIQRQGSTTADDDDDNDDTSKLLSDNNTTNEQDESSQTKVDEPHNVEC